jgi:hydroxymethylpyrimidine/phosphomethylpyrimidine kinase
MVWISLRSLRSVGKQARKVTLLDTIRFIEQEGTEFMSLSEPVVMTISGFDPLGGAGVIADLKTFGANGCYGVAAITAVDVQERPSGLNEVHPIDVRILQACMRSILLESKVKAIKIGMLATRANAEAVLEVLEANPSLPVVLDPLVRASGGVDLIDAGCLEFVRDQLLRRATVITPNLPEAAALIGMNVENVEDMKLAARKLIEMGARAVVVTGGHLERPVDVFADSASSLRTLAGDRIKPENIYGAACTFSSALAASLALGRPLAEAVILAKTYVTEAIKKAYPVGAGRVPLNQFYRLQELAELPPAGAKPLH